MKAALIPLYAVQIPAAVGLARAVPLVFLQYAGWRSVVVGGNDGAIDDGLELLAAVGLLVLLMDGAAEGLGVSDGCGGLLF